MIAEAKLRALREALERDHVVRFKNGAQIEYEDCPRCGGEGREEQPGRLPHERVVWQTCRRCGGEKVLLRVERPAGGVARFRLDDDGDVERAYAMALDGPKPKAQPRMRVDPGDDPPF